MSCNAQLYESIVAPQTLLFKNYRCWVKKDVKVVKGTNVNDFHIVYMKL